MFEFLRRKSKAEREGKRATDAEAARRLASDGPKGSRGTDGQRPLNGGQSGLLP